MRTIKQYFLALCLIAISCLAFGKAAYIKGKAIYAQHLLNQAWQHTLENGQAHKPWAWADTHPIAKLKAPQHHIEQIVLSGASGRNLAFGPGHLLSSAAPEHKGHLIIGGHRDTHFAFLEHLTKGQIIIIEDKTGASHQYQVEEFQVHNIMQHSINDRGPEQLTLVTCYPFNSLQTGGPLRYLVHAKRLNSPIEGLIKANKST